MRLKPRILTRFLASHFMRSFFGVVGVVCGITLTIAFIENLNRIDTFTDALQFSILQLLEWTPIFLPLVVFMATLMTTWKLTRSSEIPIIQGAGLSPFQWMTPFIYSALFLGLFASMILNPMTVRLGKTWQTHDNEMTQQMMLIDDAIWIREQTPTSSLVLQAKSATTKKNQMTFRNVLMLVQDENAALINRIEAKSVILDNGKFTANNPTVYDTKNNIQNPKTWTIPSVMTPDHIYDRYLKPTEVDFWKLPKFISGLQMTGINTRAHLVHFYTLLFQPLMFISMVILGMAFSMTRSMRSHAFGIKISAGVLTSFILYFLTNVFSALGISGIMPEILAVMAPPLIVSFFAGAFILYFDDL